MPTLAEIITRYEAAQLEQLADRPVLTPLGGAHVAGRRFAPALAALDVQERTTVLVQTVVGIEGPAGETYGLLISRPPVRDPQTA